MLDKTVFSRAEMSPQTQLAEWVEETARQMHDQPLEAFAQVVLNRFCEALQAVRGTFYVVSEDEEGRPLAEAMAGYGHRLASGQGLRFRPGEGLVGQMLLTPSPKHFGDLPAEAYAVEGGTGPMAIRALYLLPLEFNGLVYGVLECGAAGSFPGAALEAVKQAGRGLAAHVQSMRSRQRLSRLLEESRRYTEEIASQEEELRQNMEELQATQEQVAGLKAELERKQEAINFSTAIVEFDTEGYILDANKVFSDLLGFEADALVGKHHAELCPESFVESSSYKALWWGLRKGAFFNDRVERVARDGRHVWLDATYNPVLDENGKVTRVIKLARDVTAQVQLQEKVEAEKRRMEALLEVSVDPVICIDYRGRMQLFNRAAQNLLGYTAEEVLGQNISMLMPEPHASRHDGYLAHHQRTGETNIIGKGREVEALAKDGQRIPVDLAVTKAESGDRPVYMGVMRDLRAFKAHEQERNRYIEELQAQEEEVRQNLEETSAIQEEQARLQRMLEIREQAIDQAMCVAQLNEEGYFTYVNDRFLQTLGYEEAVLLGSHHSILMPEGEADQAAYTAFWERLRLGEAINGVMHRLRADGSLVRLQANYTPLIEEDGRVSGVYKLAQPLDEAPNAAGAEASPREFYLTTTPEGKLLWASEEFEAICGFMLEEVKGLKPADFLQGEATESAAVKRISEGLRKGKGVEEILTNYTKDGRPYRAQLRIQPMRDDRGRLQGFLGHTQVLAFLDKTTVEQA
jgi:methyl-accepting chemotaxis protein